MLTNAMYNHISDQTHKLTLQEANDKQTTELLLEPHNQGLNLAVAHSPFASKFQCGPLKISSQSSTWRVKIRKNKIV